MSLKNEEPHGPPAPDAPRPEFRFKPTEFEVANRPANSTPADAPIDVKQLYQQANAKGPLSVRKGDPPVSPRNDVHEILRTNLAHAEAQGEHEVIPARRRMSRRQRDYWTLLIAGNLLVVIVVLLLRINVMTLAFGFSATVLFSLGLTWIMWFVMDDY